MKVPLPQFRIWDYTAKKMIFFKGIFNVRPKGHRLSDLMHRSSIKDRHGNYIYEQDIIILRGKVMRWVVRYRDSGEFHALSREEDDMSMQVSAWLRRSYRTRRIVGNYYESPKVVAKWWVQAKKGAEAYKLWKAERDAEWAAEEQKQKEHDEKVKSETQADQEKAANHQPVS